MSGALHRLAGLHGIEIGTEPPADAVLVALLAALGVDASTPAAVATAAATALAAQARAWLPAWSVVDADAPVAQVPLRLPAATRTDTAGWRWTLAEEDGTRHEGDLDPVAIAVADDADGAGARWALPHRPPPGVHRLTLTGPGGDTAQGMLIVAPARAYWPAALDDGARVFGAAVPWTAVQSQRQWGIGDATDLVHLLEQWRAHGAAVLAVGDWTAALPDGRVSHRAFVDPLLIDPEAVPEWAECEAVRAHAAGPDLRERLAALRAATTIDRDALAALKGALLEGLHAHFRSAHGATGSERGRAFEAFRHGGGEALQRHALFEAVQAHLRRTGHATGWPGWPADWQDPDGEAVRAFAAAHGDAVEAQAWLQWIAHEQLAAAGQRSWTLGLGIGLMADLACLPARDGAEAWGAGDAVARGVVASPSPPERQAAGRDTGSKSHASPGAAWDVARAGDAALQAWRQALRAVMLPAGAVRLTSAGALWRQWWTPVADDVHATHAAPAGAWVHMPGEAWLAVARLESQRQRCLLVTEASSLTVAQREALAAQGVLLEDDLTALRAADGGFPTPAAVPHDRVVALTPADGPDLAAWWDGSDLAPADEAHAASAPPTPAQAQAVVGRAADRARLLLALAGEGLLPRGATVNPVSVPVVTPAFVQAAQTWLARSAAAVVLARLTDCLPTPAAGPHARLMQPLERLRFDDDLVALQRALAVERGSAPRRAGAWPLRARIPRATYRLQLHRGFDLPAATALVPYLAALGISHVYCSPLLRARPGSLHGYDVVDHGQINPELGSRSDLQRLVEALRRHGMGLLLDIVPNHMGVLGSDNAWWLDVLENGPASAYAEHFDIDWQAADPVLAGRVLVPVLGDQYGAVLDRGELQLAFDADGGRFTLRYHEHLLPIDPVDYAPLIRQALQALPAGALDRRAQDAVASLADAFEHLPPRDAVDEADRTRRQRDKRVLKAQLAQVARTLAPLAAALDDLVVALNGRPGARDGFDALDALIGRQAWRLAYWRVAGDEINYRRFFDINDLAALRMERAEVFEATHRLVLQWLADGWVDGLRIDHSDGLADPAGYFARLQQRHAEAVGAPAEVAVAAPHTRPLYLVTEKITAPHEVMPADWAVHGTTGYDFANLANNLLIDADAKAHLDRIWRLFAGDEAQDFEALAWRCRQLVMEGALAGDLTVLAGTLLRLAREDRHTRDFTLNTLRRALVDVIAAFPVYRSYVVDRPSAQDRRYFNWALGRARRLSRVADASVFDFLRRVLLGRPRPGAPPGQAGRMQAFVRRFQQVTAPVAAKGLEDTALYRHHRLISVNDVGGEPEVFGCTVAAFHAATRERAARWPHGLLATSTHDAKRSEDVRARIDVISEMPAAWRLLVRRWSRLNRRHKRTVRGRAAPTRSDEYLLYQTLAGCVPATPLDDEALAALADRVAQAMLKSAREAKVSTAWINPDLAYEAALTGFVHALLTRRDSNLFLPDLQAAVRVFGWHGALNGLTLAAVKVMSPGVPDLYQGHEGIELSLVDPDNRRPVDYGRRAGWLAAAQQTLALTDRRPRLAEWLHGATDGRAKFWTLWRALDLRRTHEALLTHGATLPLEVTGARARHLVAFARQDADALVVLVAARLTASLGLAAGEPPLGAVWGDTAIVLPPEIDMGAGTGRGFEDAITGDTHASPAGRTLAASALFAHWPVALLVRR